MGEDGNFLAWVLKERGMGWMLMGMRFKSKMTLRENVREGFVRTPHPHGTGKLVRDHISDSINLVSSLSFAILRTIPILHFRWRLCVHNLTTLRLSSTSMPFPERCICSKFFHSDVSCYTERWLSMLYSGYLLRSRLAAFPLVIQWSLSDTEPLLCARHHSK